MAGGLLEGRAQVRQEAGFLPPGQAWTLWLVPQPPPLAPLPPVPSPELTMCLLSSAQRLPSASPLSRRALGFQTDALPGVYAPSGCNLWGEAYFSPSSLQGTAESTEHFHPNPWEREGSIALSLRWGRSEQPLG